MKIKFVFINKDNKEILQEETFDWGPMMSANLNDIIKHNNIYFEVKMNLIDIDNSTNTAICLEISNPLLG